jgi:hypothetical protein
MLSDPFPPGLRKNQAFRLVRVKRRSIFKTVSKRRNDAHWERQLEDFFASPLAEKAGSFLSDKARIALHIDAHHSYLFQREAGRNRMRIAVEPQADVHFHVPLSTMRHLLELGAQPTSGIGTMGVAVVEHLFHAEPEKKIRFHVDTGFLQLWAKGYFSVLKAGGPEVASYLAEWGYGSLTRLKDLLKQVRR